MSRYGSGYAQGWADAMEKVRLMVLDAEANWDTETPSQRALLHEFVEAFARATSPTPPVAP